LYVFELDVGDVDSGLSFALALWVKGIEHTSRSSPIGLLLLLRAEIYCPPDGLVHGDVLVEDVVDDAIAVGARVRLEVDALEGLLHHCVAEGDIANAVDLGVWRDGADREAHSQPNGNVLNQHVLSAVDVPVAVVVGGLRHDYVIIVLAGDVVDMEVPAVGVDAVSVEGEQRDCADEVEPSEDVELRSGVDLDVDVVDGHVDRLVDLYVEAGRVLYCEVVDAQIGGLVHCDEMRPASACWHVFLGDQPAVQPPDVSPPVDLAPACDRQVVAELDADEVLVAESVGVVRPVLDAVAGAELALYFQDDVVAVVEGEGEGVELAPWHHNYPRISG
jgi:hypothetical protein